MWSDVDFFRVINYLSKLDDSYDLWSDVDEKYCQDDDVEDKDEEEETLPEEDDVDRARYAIMKSTGDGTILEATDLNESNDLVFTHMVESLGKLLLVRRKLQWPSNGIGFKYTRSAEVFEANITTGAWMPVTYGLHG
jgi:hypothetical protein